MTLSKKGPALVLKLDNPGATGAGRAVNEWLYPLFRNDAPHITCICDYVVFYPAPSRDDSRLFVFLCELTSNNPRGAGKQICNGRLICDFLIAMARHHETVTRDAGVIYRGLVFSTKGKSPKGSLKPKPPNYWSYDAMPDLRCAHYRCGVRLQLDMLCA